MCGARWINRRDEKDQPVLTPDRKPIYDAVIEFRYRQTRERFANLFLEAPQRTNPELFDREGEL
jgi:hypothetical protein